MKKYMAYSFATLWTLVLIVGLVAAIIHQNSRAELNLNHQIHNLQFDLDQQIIKHDAYREWVMSWR